MGYTRGMKKRIITIAGKLGSGKSSTAKKLAAMLGYRHFSSGDLFRQAGLELGLDILKANQASEANSAIDDLVDQKMRDLGNEDGIVIDSRLAFHWIPDSFKVFLELSDDVAAARIHDDLAANPDRQKSDPVGSLDEVKAKMIERLQSEQKRFKALYGVDHMDHANFDLVINTGDPLNSLDAVVHNIHAAYQAWLTK